jgi:two-component system sensor histidine kinase CiaH
MNEQKILKKQLFKYIKTNMLIFIIVFSIFGLFMYKLVSSITFETVGFELNDNIENVKSVLENLNKIQFKDKNDMTSNKLDEWKEYNILSSITNPKIICIIRDKEGKIINSNLNFVSDDYEISMEFDSNLIDEIYEVIVDEEYYYRGMTIDLENMSDDETDIGYIQLLSNVDTEKELVSVYQKFILWSIMFGILISLIASAVLAKKNLEPLADFIKRQNEFVQNVSHEIRTPLTIIQAKQELLLSEPNSKIIDKSEEINTTLHETKRMTKLTKDLMLLSKADNKQFILVKEDVDIDEFMTNTAKNYNEIVEIQEKKLVLNLNYKKKAFIDTNKIYQVMVILLDNALKYTEKGDTIEICTYAKEGKCVIEVKDTGIGISDSAMKHIFDRFYREDTARSRETGGSGLGLSIADMIISAHSGTIKVSHNGNKGTVFTIKLPR